MAEITEDTKTPLLYSNNVNKKHFSVTKDNLSQLVEHPSLLSSFGGTSGLCQVLQVDPTVGLLPDESFNPNYGIVPQESHAPFVDRKAIFGVNEIPEAPVKTIWQLIWAAYNDQTLSKY
jgi:Ca2+-transporting ATPase